MTTSQIADLIRLTPHRIFCLILTVPALGAMWFAVDRSPAKALLLAGAVLWLAFVLRTWSWYSRRPRDLGVRRSTGLY